MQSPAGHARSPSPFANLRVFLVASPVWPSPSNTSTGIPFCRVHKTGSSSSIPNSCPADSSIVGLRASLAPGGDDSIMPSKADEIRAYALERYVRPWRGSDEKRLAIRAGDVVREMGLHNATPNVCSSLASQRFQRDAGIVLVHRDGPHQSTTTTFHYEPDRAIPDLPTRPRKSSTAPPGRRQPRSLRPASCPDDRWRSADLCLVSCVSVKRSAAAPARDLYVSHWFRKARACIEALGCPWYILSAKHGLLDPNSMIDPYDETLKAMPVDRRRIWARGVIADLAPRLAGVDIVTLFAGMAYREFLEPELRGRGLQIHVPMQGMRIGQQLSWLSGQDRP